MVALVAISDMDDLVSYNHAMAGSESNLWLDVMKVEMHSIVGIDLGLRKYLTLLASGGK